MRKNLFLTLALLLATFAGATAQDWSVTLDGTVGLPGDTALNENGEKFLRFQSGIIKASAPIKTLRFSVAGTVNNEKPNGNNVIFALSELNVYNADMSEELTYTAKSNADHNTLTQSFDGKGLMALNDGKNDSFFHSMWGGDGKEVTDYHYIELTFEEAIKEFVIEWDSRYTKMTNAPTIVGLTAGGVDFVPYTDRTAEFPGTKITDFDTLADGAYFVIRGNAPAQYDTYDNKTGDKTNKEPVEGCGPMYTKPGGEGLTAKEPTVSHVAKLIATEDEDDTYYIYYPVENAYLSGDASQNALNSANNGWQMATKDIAKAAKVKFKALDKGDFEMYYYTEIEVEDNPETTDKDESWSYEGDVYLAADPRCTDLHINNKGRMKIFSPVKKSALESQGWCEGFGLVCAFNWSFYQADYEAPVWAKVYDLGLLTINANKLMKAIENYDLLAGYVSTLEGIINDLKGALAGTDNMSDEEIKTAVDDNKLALSNFICDISWEEYDAMTAATNTNGWTNWKKNISDDASQIGKFSTAAYEQYITPGEEFMTDFSDNAEYDNSTNYDNYFAGVLNYFANREANINAFLASKFVATSSKLPMTFEVANTIEQEVKVNTGSPINGFRWTLLETKSNNTNGSGYVFTSFVELEIVNNANSEKVTLDAALISTNSNQGDEGSINGLVDGIKAAGDYKGEAPYGWYWHAIWGGGAHTPAGPAYLDIKFPAGVSLSDFTIKFTNRSGQEHNIQTKFVISEYGKAHDDDGIDYYKVTVGEKITDLAQLEDGGLYLLQGNLNVNLAKDAAKPRFYAGATPYTEKAAEAANANCVYMFKKVGNSWNILSLSTAKYFKGAALAELLQDKADNVKIVDSENLENTWVIYTEIDSVLESDYTHKIDENNSIAFGKTTVKATAQVYMDWAGSLASRPCYSPLPGKADPQFTALTEELKVSSSCGDYLHFNKTNGEGEWSIYKVTMENEYYAYMLALAKEVEELNILAGTNPGCVKADAEVAADFEEAKAAIAVAAENKDTENAENVTKAMITAIEALGNLEIVGFEPTSVYRIESALEAFLEKTGYTRSVYAGAKSLAWTVTPASFDGENYDFLFRISNDEDEMETYHAPAVPENEKGKACILQNIGNASWIGKDWSYAERPALYVMERLESDIYNIKASGTDNRWHANNHGSGQGYGSNLVYYGGGVNSASAWRFIYVGEVDDYELSVEDVVVKGDEVVSVSYFTTAGAAIAEPVKGINIVVKVYANGVVEATKVLVK